MNKINKRDLESAAATGDNYAFWAAIHARDKALLEAVVKEIESRLWFHQGHDQDKINEGIYQAVEVISNYLEGRRCKTCEHLDARLGLECGKYKERLIMEKDKNGFFEIRQCEECKKEVANGKVDEGGLGTNEEKTL